MTRSGRGYGAGSCGELAQGFTSDGDAFQVSLPIDVGAVVEVAIRDADITEIVGIPPTMTKARSAIESTLAALGASPKRVEVRHHTRLPTGKGMGSSTADIVAAARATADALGDRFAPDDLARLAGSIEPSDGAMYERTAIVRRQGPALRTLPWAPTFTTLVLVPPATRSTDTAEVGGLRVAARSYDTILAQLDRAARRRDRRPFVAAAATSGRLHHDIAGNEWVPHLDAVATAVGAWGWNIAHTGTVAGLWFDATSRGRSAARAAARRLAAWRPDMRTLTVTAGRALPAGAP